MGYLSTDKSNRTVLNIIVQPKAKRTQFRGLYDNMIRLSVAAPPVDGKANRKIVAYLAEIFGLKKNEITMVAGEHSRRKRCIIGKLEEDVVRRKVEKYLQA